MNGADPLENPVSRLFAFVLAVIVVAGLLHLGLRIRQVQIDETANYSYASARQSVRRVQIGGERGRILDRHGNVLAGNRQSLSIVCRPAFFQKRTWDETVVAIDQGIVRAAETVGRSSRLTKKDIRRHIRQELAMPLLVWRDITEDELARFSEQAQDLPGFELIESDERVYPQGALAAHLLGYVGRDRGEVVAGDEKYNFFSFELRGRAGLEHFYDGFLRGVNGERRLTVDARGFAIREQMIVEPIAGPDLQLTLDLEIQREVEHQLQGQQGACVVLDPRTGDVLAMASMPGFDPNEFVPTISHERYELFSQDSHNPFLNRACSGLYEPGSTFKPVVALAALTAGVPANLTYCCSGVYSLGGMHLRCASRWGHGDLDMRHALMKSCNPYFCNLGVDIGTNALISAAAAFGFGEKTGLDFVADKAGTVPTAEWKLRNKKEKWFLGDVAQMSIGQGMLLVTPLQMALVVGAIGTGYRVTPHLKRDIVSERTPLPFSSAHLSVVREGMRFVVAGDGGTRGTGWRGGEGVPVAVSGKTGTAEIGSAEKRRKNTWFIAYAPSENPTVAVALVIENGESGGGTAAPRVGAILRTVFGK